MRTHLRRRPQVESLESISLLSAAAVPGAAAIVAAQAGTTTSQEIHLTGIAKGTYHAHVANPDTGTTFTFFGRPSLIRPLGISILTGNIQSPGFIAHGQSHGLLVIANPSGSLTLRVTGPPQNGSTPVPDVFTYKITNSSGRFRGDTGSGYIVLTLTPNPTANIALVETGRFSMTFLTVAPP